MLTYFSDKTDWVCAWVSERLSGFNSNDFKPCSTLGIMRDGQLVAGLIFNNFRKKSRDIHLTIAADTPAWISRGSLRVIFNYIFVQLGCIRTTIIIAKSNKRARKLALGLGYQYEGKMRKGFDGLEDAVIYGMLHNECRWLGEMKTTQVNSRSA